MKINGQTHYLWRAVDHEGKIVESYVTKSRDKGAMPPLVLVVDDCRAAHAQFSSAGVEFTQEPIARFGSVDASFRDPSGNGWNWWRRGDGRGVLLGRAEAGVRC